MDHIHNKITMDRLILTYDNDCYSIKVAYNCKQESMVYYFEIFKKKN